MKNFEKYLNEANDLDGVYNKIEKARISVYKTMLDIKKGSSKNSADLKFLSDIYEDMELILDKFYKYKHFDKKR